MDNWQQDFEWEDILKEIRMGNCVLIIGPDLIHYDNDRSLFQQFCEALQNDQKLNKAVNWSAPFIFENEELLQLEKVRTLTGVYTFLRGFYQSRHEFDVPFQKIAELPFHLIISLLPDERLVQVFQRENRNAQFSYYPRKK